MPFFPQKSRYNKHFTALTIVNNRKLYQLKQPRTKKITFYKNIINLKKIIINDEYTGTELWKLFN